MSQASTAFSDLRFDLGAAAARARRHNSPGHLLTLAALILFVSMIALLISGWQYVAAGAKLREQEKTSLEMESMAKELKQINDAVASGQAQKINRPETWIRSTIQQAATTAGMKNNPPVPVPRTKTEPAVQGVKRTKLEYDVHDESLAAILQWVQIAQHDVPGLEVYKVEIKPDAPNSPNWSVKVVFSRWEREGG